MGKFSSQEIESQYDLIKMLLAEPEKYKDAIDAVADEGADAGGQVFQFTFNLPEKTQEEKIAKF